MSLASIVKWKLPTAQFRWSGDTLDGLEWLSVDLPRPTDADLVQWTAEYEAAGGELSERATRIDALASPEGVLARALTRVVWEELQKCQGRAGQTLLSFPEFRDRVRAVLRTLLT